MSIHKLDLDRAKDSSTPFSISVAFQHDLCELGEAVIKTRAIQAFDNAATHIGISVAPQAASCRTSSTISR